jgi:hypothetical protein
MAAEQKTVRLAHLGAQQWPATHREHVFEPESRINEK